MNFRSVTGYLAKFWLVVAIATSIFGIYTVWANGFASSKMYVLLPCVAWAIWLKNFIMKRKLDKGQNKDQD